MRRSTENWGISRKQVPRTGQTLNMNWNCLVLFGAVCLCHPCVVLVDFCADPAGCGARYLSLSSLRSGADTAGWGHCGSGQLPIRFAQTIKRTFELVCLRLFDHI